MIKMHQKPFRGRTPPGPAGGASAPLIAVWGLLLRGGKGEGKGKGGRKEGGE